MFENNFMELTEEGKTDLKNFMWIAPSIRMIIWRVSSGSGHVADRPTSSSRHTRTAEEPSLEFDEPGNCLTSIVNSIVSHLLKKIKC